VGLRLKSSYYTIIRGFILFKWAATTRLKFLELISKGYLGEAYNRRRIKTYRNFVTFANFELLELEVLIICLVIGCVSLHRDRR
jgi:hypothetical protein